MKITKYNHNTGNKSGFSYKSPPLKDSFHSARHKNIALDFVKFRGQQSALRFAEELNLNDIRYKHKSLNDNIFNLSDGTALLIACHERKFKPSDDYVNKAEIRKKICLDLQDKYPGQEIYWQEKVGVAEVGDGFYATIPVFRSGLGFAGLGLGFSAGFIIRYRTSTPVVNNNTNKIALLPLSPEAAMLMPAGQEIEFCGQAKFRGDLAFVARYGAQALIAVAGAQASVSAVTNLAVEYSLTVMSLNGSNKVRVTIRQLDQECLGLNAAGFAGLIVPGNSLWQGNWGAPQAGHGLLKYFVEHKGNANFESYLSDYTTLSLSFSTSYTHKGVHICSYDLDLTVPEAAQAYSSLLNLDPRVAEFWAQQKHGVQVVKFKERQHNHKKAIRLALCAQKLFFIESSKTKSRGELIDHKGNKEIYQDKSYKKHRENWFTGQRDSIWEITDIKTPDGHKVFYRFNYKKTDLFTRQAEIHKFIKFMEALDVKINEDSKKKLIEMSALKKLFSTADDSVVTIDIYFNLAGISRIKEASLEKIMQVYIKKRAELKKSWAHHPWAYNKPRYYARNQRIYENYKKLSKNYLSELCNKKTIRSLEKYYFNINARELKKDYKIWRKARNFALKTRALLKENQQNSVDKFFVKLGKRHGTNYSVVIPALVNLAGRENILVHTLSFIGGGVELKARDEGALKHPRNELLDLIMRADSLDKN